MLKADGHEKAVNRKTGLLLDPYFSASKILWLLRESPAAAAACERIAAAEPTVAPQIPGRGSPPRDQVRTG